MSDDVILERLWPANDPISKELRSLRSALERQPNDLGAAKSLVERFIEIARKTGDPRYTGYAEAVIEPFAAADSASPDALVLLATTRQRRHDFTGAIDDLDRVLERSPGHPQALLTRASLHLVLGNYQASAADCTALSGIVLPLIVATCGAGVDAMTGDASAAALRLAEALAKTPADTPPSIRAWGWTTLGELSQRLGDWSVAATHFDTAATIDDDDLYLRSARIDLLLDRGRAAEALALIGDDVRSDALLLRRALIAKELNEKELSALTETLSTRFAASAIRQDQRHLREEARFRLHLTDEPERALKLALKNWREQKEQWDARLVLEAALAAERPEAASATLAWINTQGWRDVTLDSLIHRLRGEGE